MTAEDWTGMTAVGKGVGAGIRGGMAYVVAGPLFAEIEAERAAGPLFCEAVRGARALRVAAAARVTWPWLVEYGDRVEGIPAGWASRP